MSAEFIQGVTKEWQDRAKKRMSRFDDMTVERRDLVNEFGMGAVDTCLAVGVTNPKHIRHIILYMIDQGTYSNGNGKLVSARCAELGRSLRGVTPELRAECIAVFLKMANAQ